MFKDISTIKKSDNEKEVELYKRNIDEIIFKTRKILEKEQGDELITLKQNLEDLEQHKCSVLFHLLSGKKDCDYDPVLFKKYNDDFQINYQFAFIRHVFSKSQQQRYCYGGLLSLFVSKKEKWASLKTDKEMIICPNKINLIQLAFRIGEYPSHLKNQPEKLNALPYKSGHASIIIIDTISFTINLYESYGTYIYPYNIVRDFLIEYIQTHPVLSKNKYEVLSGETICPIRGPQSKTKDENCFLWSLLFLYMQLQCTHANAYDIQTMFVQTFTIDRLDHLMKAWLCFLLNYIDKYHIKTVIDWYRDVHNSVIYPLHHKKILSLKNKNQYTKAMKIIDEINRQEVIENKQLDIDELNVEVDQWLFDTDETSIKDFELHKNRVNDLLDKIRAYRYTLAVDELNK